MNLLKNLWGNISRDIKNSLEKLGRKLKPIKPPIIIAFWVWFASGLLVIFFPLVWFYTSMAFVVVYLFITELVGWIEEKRAGNPDRNMYVELMRGRKQ